ncbi:hypothetical protein BDR03DRAFT_946477 [Suillus americanus]|nr:hypothetical protein BDR03DRAFT_946477 [Suillus americanus]
MEELLIQAMCAAAVLLNPTAGRRCKSLESKLLRILAPRDICTPSPDRLSRCPRLIQPSILCWINRSVCRQEIVAGGHRQLTPAMMSCLLTPSSFICASMLEDPHIVVFTAPGMDAASS